MKTKKKNAEERVGVKKKNARGGLRGAERERERERENSNSS